METRSSGRIVGNYNLAASRKRQAEKPSVKGDLPEGRSSFFIVKKLSSETQSKRNGSSSKEEHKVNALASGAEEGRDKLRKAAGSCK